ncbi:RNA-binding domain-containing protein [Patellaria atrata CBS 101060]|uniref:RNA-binding domain-containing protein n=1 Tax=Patellaria atrata CBS 101060 TaxID=1346257 RepID=A0A9P4VVG1_9PEZI|nr:RNA-binding domain-containing protein [Patellaria atrata CBS 101060]
MASKASGGKPSAIPPNQTLYCTNLPDKLQKADLRRSLYILFSTYGSVLDVVALKTMKMRGQAHIVFRDIQSSTQAMRALQGFDFFGKQMSISYAKGKSNTIAKLDGTFNIPTPTSTGTNAPTTTVATDLQKSIFNAAPGSSAPPKTDSSAKIPENQSLPNGGDPSVHGTKRGREDESDEEDAPMEVDEDEAMEESDED